ncbi:MAG: 50S ribosomal protein L11 methyltransferase [Gemmatimonadetes bacterium]|nr:50S ribosomal protein L11 methyltransferase [Gemmatimonadota bacterium]
MNATRADGADPIPPVVPDDVLESLLDDHAPLTPVPLCPEVSVFTARSLVGIWEAAERVAGVTLPSPFWAYAWPAGAALARVILDEPDRVRGRTIVDFGAGGGVSSLACALAGAARVIANDVDPWALAVARIAAYRQGLIIETLQGDLATSSDIPCDVLLCADLGYDRTSAPKERAVIGRARAARRTVLVADAGRAWFDARRLQPIARFEVAVPPDLEGVDRRVATVYGTHD